MVLRSVHTRLHLQDDTFQSLSKPVHDEPTVARKKETRRRGIGPLTQDDVKEKQQKVLDDLTKINKVTAVMAVYNNDATIEAAACQSNLSLSFICDIIAQARSKNLKEEPNKFMQVTRFVHAWLAVNSRGRGWTPVQ